MSAGPGFEAYSDRFESISKDRDTLRTAGVAVAIAGGLLAGFGAVFLVIDVGATDAPAPSASLTPVLLPGGAGLAGLMRF